MAARLEGAVGSTGAGGYPGAGSAAAAAPAAPAAPAAVADCEIAREFDAFLTQNLPNLESLAKATGVQDLTEATEMVSTAMRLLRGLFAATGRCKKPKDAEWVEILKPVMELGGKAQQACDNRSDHFQARKAVSESLNVVTLVTVASPPTHVKNVLETMDFHAMKVMQKKVEAETNWIKALKALVKALQDWCVQQCNLGLTWKFDGEDASEFFKANPLGSTGASAAPAAGKGKGKGPAIPKGGIPAPPPELAARMKGEPAAPAGGGGGAGGMAAIFGAINQFDTGALKKVTSDMKTKNQVRDGSAVVPAVTSKAPAAAPGRSQAKGPKGPPIKELQRELNWLIENFADNPNVTLDEAQMQQLVMIINCRNCTIRINSKVKSISIDSCEKVNVIFGDVISAVELVNSDRCQVQTLGKVNSFAIDKCNGVNVWLSKESLAAEFVTSKSSEMNVTIPEDDGDMIEIPIPEQFVTTIVGKKLKTEVSSLYH